jgi:hypothetical protein
MGVGGVSFPILNGKEAAVHIYPYGPFSANLSKKWRWSDFPLNMLTIRSLESAAGASCGKEECRRQNVE